MTSLLLLRGLHNFFTILSCKLTPSNLDHAGSWYSAWKLYVLISIHPTTREAWLSSTTLKNFTSEKTWLRRQYPARAYTTLVVLVCWLLNQTHEHFRSHRSNHKSPCAFLTPPEPSRALLGLGPWRHKNSWGLMVPWPHHTHECSWVLMRAYVTIATCSLVPMYVH